MSKFPVPLVRIVLFVVALFALFFAIVYSFFSERISLPEIFSEAGAPAENRSR